MKKKLIYLLFVLSFPLLVSAQNTLIQGTKITENKLYLKMEDNELRAFVKKDNEAGSESLDDIKKFSMTTKDCSVYIQWLNPLHYQIKWTDSTFKNESDEAVKTYITKLVELFGSPVSNLNKDNEQSKAAIARSGLAAPGNGINELHYPPNGFKNAELTFLYLMLRQMSTPLSNSEIVSINAITDNVGSLDNFIAEKIPEKTDEQFKKLYNIPTAQQLTIELPNVKTVISEFETKNFKLAENKAVEISKALAGLSLTDKLIEGFYKSKIEEFVKQSLSILAANRELVKKFEPVIKLMENSIAIPGDVPNTNPGIKTEYYKTRNIKLTEGNGLHTVAILIEKEYDVNTHDFKTKSENKKAVMQFRRYDPITVFVSAGGFWANTTLKGFGVSKDLKVTEDNINKDNFVAAAFLNFNFIPSRYLSPLIQLGIDPTKKRPFLLLGGGFSIPVAKIAFTAGGVWTWEAALKNLHLDQVIQSTTELDKDISYKFSMEPRGWYLGIQYNFK